MSIRLKLTLFYTITLAVIILLLGVFLLSFLSNRLQSDLDSTLAEDAQNLVSSLQHRGWGMGMGMGMPYMNPTASNIYQVMDTGGRVLAISPQLAEDKPLPVNEEAVNAAVNNKNVWVTQFFQGEKFRVLYVKFGSSQYILGLAAPLKQLEQALSRLRRLLFSGGVVSLLLAAAAGWLLAGSALSPIKRITATAASINDTKDLTSRVPYQGPNDEIGHLAATFNNMLGKLQEAYVNLEENNRRQVRFVSDASHELRTPLTVIRGNVELLERVELPDPTLQQEALADISAEAKRMSRMVDDLLYLARSDQGKKKSLQTVAVKPITQQASRNAALIAQQKGIKFSADLHPDFQKANFLGNDDDFYRLLMILLDNALKYTPAGGEVLFTAQIEAGKLKIAVTDTGIGIDPKDVPNIFDRFFRSDISRSTGGTGLGLAIAKEIANYHRTAIAVKSTPGQGSQFTFTVDLLS